MGYNIVAGVKKVIRNCEERLLKSKNYNYEVFSILKNQQTRKTTLEIFIAEKKNERKKVERCFVFNTLKFLSKINKKIKIKC